MVTVREMRPDDDFGAVLKLCRDFFKEYENNHGDFFDIDQMSDDSISGRFLSSFEDENSATLIALDDNKIVGYASIVVREQPQFYKVKRVGAVSALMVDKAWRRQGIATQLLEESRQFFRNKRLKYFMLYTAVANREALGLYEGAGMEPLHISFLGEV